MKQVELNFEGGLLDQYPEFADCLKASVYSCGRQFKAIASDLDLSSSSLSRKLAQNPEDNVSYPAQKLPELFEATQDFRPIFWLIERFIEDAETQKKHAAKELTMLLPKIKAALEAMSE